MERLSVIALLLCSPYGPFVQPDDVFNGGATFLGAELGV